MIVRPRRWLISFSRVNTDRGVFRIERRGCLIAQQNFRLGRQRPGDAGSLLLAAGKAGQVSYRAGRWRPTSSSISS